ncbi:MAG: M20/M25/M40 family metallo-hydrolase [Anaerolineales bacterium]|nr:M20/M25/M40 family metallo-hydrolase [Anaerolineales bacterium]
MPPKANPTPIYERPLELLQNLIRFDTTNPPGNERACIEYIQGLLKEAGIPTTIVARTPERPNLIARLKGRGQAPPLLLYGHVDVVTTENQQWTHPPFEGRIVDGYIWGRGALDMKGPVALMLAAFLKAKAKGVDLPGDVLFAAVADEEAGDDFGVRYLVHEHPRLFEGVRYAFGEFGGFNMSMAGTRVYPIMVAEKQICWMKATLRGKGGHASMPVQGQAMAKLGRVLAALDRRALPVHITPAVRLMFESIRRILPGATGALLGQLLNPLLTDRILKLLGGRGAMFSNLFHNTVSPTMLQASAKVNVIPAEVTLEMDGRLLPGLDPATMLAEVRKLIGRFGEVEINRSDPGPATPDMALFETLGGVLHELDPRGTAVPFVLGAVTDARFLSRLGIQTYGFTPLQLPEDFSFLGAVHGADERLPVDALDFGVEAVFRALQRFH